MIVWRYTVANPRIDDLRRKLDKEPGSRLFAQLAEELRKEGELAEAIRVSRQGLDKHPNYPSARMTLGHALLDSGDLAAARREFETVLKGAPDNILASRYLAECLEGLGETAEALARYKATLILAPGDKQVQAHIQALERASGAPMPASTQTGEPSAPRARPAAAPSASEPPEPPPIRVVDFEGPMELVSPFEEMHPAAAAPVPPPAPAPSPEPEAVHVPQPEAAVEGAAPAADPQTAAPAPPMPLEEEEFDTAKPEPITEPEEEPILEAEPLAADAAVPEPMTAAPEPTLEPDVLDEEFDVDAPAPGPPRMTFRDIVEEPEPGSHSISAAPPALPAPTPAAAAPEPELASPTLAELYFNQGFLDKAIEVYRRLLQREPGNDRFRARLVAIEARLHRAAAESPDGPPSSREEAIGRAITRLQDLRAALARRN